MKPFTRTSANAIGMLMGGALASQFLKAIGAPQAVWEFVPALALGAVVFYVADRAVRMEAAGEGSTEMDGS